MAKHRPAEPGAEAPARGHFAVLMVRIRKRVGYLPNILPIRSEDTQDWLIKNEVDAGARDVFRQLDSHLQKEIMADGNVAGTANHSATPMKRIRDRVGCVREEAGTGCLDV